MKEYTITIIIFMVFFVLGFIMSYILSRSKIRELGDLLDDFYLENQALTLKVQEFEAKLRD